VGCAAGECSKSVQRGAGGGLSFRGRGPAERESPCGVLSDTGKANAHPNSKEGKKKGAKSGSGG